MRAGPPPPVGRAGKRTESRVVGIAAVDEPCACEVDDAAARSREDAAPRCPRQSRTGRPGRRGPRARTPCGRSAMLAPQTSSISRSCRPASSVVIGGASRPHIRSRDPSSRNRIGPPKTRWSGCRRRPSTSSRSHPAGASTSSSTNTTNGGLGGCDPRVARGVQAGHALPLDIADPLRSCRRRARVMSRGRSDGPSSTTSTSYVSLPRSCTASDSSARAGSRGGSASAR